MKLDPHERARFLIEEALVTKISEGDLIWLERHVEECAACKGYQELCTRIVSGLHSLSFEMDPEMSRRVQEAIASPRTTDWASRWVLAAAALIVLVSIPVLWHARENQRERADALLLERV